MAKHTEGFGLYTNGREFYCARCLGQDGVADMVRLPQEDVDALNYCCNCGAHKGNENARRAGYAVHCDFVFTESEEEAAHNNKDYDACGCYECLCRLHSMGAINMDAEL